MDGEHHTHNIAIKTRPLSEASGELRFVRFGDVKPCSLVEGGERLVNLKMAAASSFETLLIIHQTTRSYLDTCYPDPGFGGFPQPLYTNALLVHCFLFLDPTTSLHNTIDETSQHQMLYNVDNGRTVDISQDSKERGRSLF